MSVQRSIFASKFGAVMIVSLSSVWCAHGSGTLQEVWSQPEKTPIERVVNLLRKMKEQLESEATGDSEMYDKMVCWCKSNENEKAAAIAKAESEIQVLESEIQERSARFGKLATEVDALKKQIEEDTNALRQLQAIREGENNEFLGEETDLTQAITNLRNAIAILSKHHTSLLQLDAPLLSGLRVVLHSVSDRHALLQARHSRSAKSFLAISTSMDSTSAAGSLLLKNFLKDVSESSLPLKFAERLLERKAGEAFRASRSAMSFLQVDEPADGKPQSYDSQSDTIYGVLKQMLEDFEAELASSQKEEQSAAERSVELEAAKAEQLTVGKAKLDELETELAGNGKALSDAKENLELTRQQRAEDVEFLRNLKLTCTDLDRQWEERSKTRSEEISAVADTLVILTEDDNRERLSKARSAPVALLQVALSSRNSVMRAKRAQAADILRRADVSGLDMTDLLAAWDRRPRGDAVVSSRSRDRLNQLAAMLQLDSFTKVNEMIDKLVADMKAEEAEEVKFKENCTMSLQENEKATHTKTNEKQAAEARIEQITALTQRLASEIQEAQQQIAETEMAVKEAGQTREGQNWAFQTTVVDQRAVQDILTKAVARLQEFYKRASADEAASALLQDTQTPPVQFNTYRQNAGSSPVIGLLEQIVEDSKKLEAEASQGEFKAQRDYETMVKDSLAVIESLTQGVNEKTAMSGAAMEDKARAASNLASANGELASLDAYNADLHLQCDFVLKNFDIRQSGRKQEMESIQAAKAILAGAKET